MDESSAVKSPSLATLVIQNIANLNELKANLNEIIKTGKDYEYDVSNCIKSLLVNNDPEIVLLSVQAISELAKCENKRESYAQKEIIEPILNKVVTSDVLELVKHCCRALGNLCCDCDTARKVILECDGIPILIKLLENTLQEVTPPSVEIKMLICKTLLNFAIGGSEFTDPIMKGGLIELLKKILTLEVFKNDMNDDLVSTALLIMSLMNENKPDFMFEPEVNTVVLQVLRETASIDVSELCLEHLHTQAEHDSVKTLLAREQGVQLVCTRLEQVLLAGRSEERVDDVARAACDLVVIVLTGDEAMQILYNNGMGEVYHTMVRWLDATNWHLLSTAVLAVGNFARRDEYCVHMMENGIFDKLLGIFEIYHGFSVNIQKEPDKKHPIDIATVTKIQHAALSAIRNLTVPVANKRVAAARGKAVPVLLAALPAVEDHHVAYKLLAAIRMLVDGQEGVAAQLAQAPAALASVARWASAGEGAGAAAEAPRLLAWAARRLRHQPHWRSLVQVDGCISCLINMLLNCHSVMQNESILALTLLAIQSLSTKDPEYDFESSFVSQLLKSDIGKHISMLIETNCTKMPVEVAENLLAFLDITSKKKELAVDYKEAKVQESLQKFMDGRSDLSDDLKNCVLGVIAIIAENGEK